MYRRYLMTLQKSPGIDIHHAQDSRQALEIRDADPSVGRFWPPMGVVFSSIG